MGFSQTFTQSFISFIRFIFQLFTYFIIFSVSSLSRTKSLLVLVSTLYTNADNQIYKICLLESLSSGSLSGIYGVWWIILIEGSPKIPDDDLLFLQLLTFRGRTFIKLWWRKLEGSCIEKFNALLVYFLAELA